MDDQKMQAPTLNEAADIIAATEKALMMAKLNRTSRYYRTLQSHIAAALRQRDEAHAAAVARANGRADALQERVYQLAAFIDSRHIGYDRRWGVYRCQDCDAHAAHKRDIEHSSRCLVGRFTAWQEEVRNG